MFVKTFHFFPICGEYYCVSTIKNVGFLVSLCIYHYFFLFPGHCEIGRNSSSTSSTADDQHLISDHLACAKDEVSRLRSANDKAALEVKDNQKALDAMEQSKAERKQALKRLEYDVNVIEKEGRKLAKEYEKVLNINLDDILDDPKAAAPLRQHQEPEVVHQLTGNKKNVIKKETSIDVAAAPETEDYEEEIYTLLNSSSSTSSSYTVSLNFIRILIISNFF